MNGYLFVAIKMFYSFAALTHKKMPLEDNLASSRQRVIFSLQRFSTGSGCNIGFKKVGCFKDVERNRALNVLLLTGRDSSSDVYDGTGVDWSNFAGYISG